MLIGVRRNCCLYGSLQTLIHSPISPHLLEEGHCDKRCLNCFFPTCVCGEQQGQGELPRPGEEGLFPRMQLGTFGEGRVLQPVDGKRNKLAETLQGCSTELCPSVMEKEIC